MCSVYIYIYVIYYLYAVVVIIKHRLYYIYTIYLMMMDIPIFHPEFNIFKFSFFWDSGCRTIAVEVFSCPSPLETPPKSDPEKITSPRPTTLNWTLQPNTLIRRRIWQKLLVRTLTGI